jgi:hypothetical protein
LSPVGPVGSSFDTTAVPVTLTNTGSVPAYYQNVITSETDNNSTFESELAVCDYSTGSGTGHFIGTDYNGLVSGDLGTQSVVTAGTEGVIQPGDTDSFTIDFYAGTETDSCAASTTIPSLTTGAEAGSLAFTIGYSFTG